MTAAQAQALSIAVGEERVSALALLPLQPKAAYVLAHGAGAGMTHPFLEAAARGLFERGVATLRFQFPAMELFDQLGGHTVLHFGDLKANVSLPPDTFHFTPPKGADVIDEDAAARK